MTTISFTLAEFRKRISSTAEHFNQNSDDIMAVFMNEGSQPVTKRDDNPRIKFTSYRGRTSSLHCNASQCFAPENPPFKKEDLEKKLKICGVSKWKMCAICRRDGGVSQGDHIWERKGFVKETGYYGIVKGKWNTLPVCGACNHSYKEIILTDGTEKNIGRDDLTEEELELVEPEDVKKVTMVSNWKAYAKKRDAVLRFRLTKVQEKYIENLERRIFANIEQEERNMQRFLQESAQD